MNGAFWALLTVYVCSIHVSTYVSPPYGVFWFRRCTAVVQTVVSLWNHGRFTGVDQVLRLCACEDGFAGFSLLVHKDCATQNFSCTLTGIKLTFGLFGRPFAKATTESEDTARGGGGDSQSAVSSSTNWNLNFAEP